MHEWNEEIIERIGPWIEGRTYNHLRYGRVVKCICQFKVSETVSNA